MDCAAEARMPIVADGGIKAPGDIAKAVVLGADMVMVGGMLSGFLDSPGGIVVHDGRRYKDFWGSASAYQDGKTSRIEGTKNLVPIKEMRVLEYMKYLEECLQSSISYAGGKDVAALKGVLFQ